MATNGTTTRVQLAGAKAIEAQNRLRRAAESLGEELGAATPPHGVPTAFLSEEDSMVVAIDQVIKATKP